MDVLLETPPPHSLETSRTFFDTAETPEALFFLQAQGLSDVNESLKVHLGQGQDLIISIQIYLKCKHTYENAGFCILPLMITKYYKFSTDYRNFPRFLTEKLHRCQPPPPPPTLQRFS